MLQMSLRHVFSTVEAEGEINIRLCFVIFHTSSCCITIGLSPVMTLAAVHVYWLNAIMERHFKTKWRCFNEVTQLSET